MTLTSMGGSGGKADFYRLSHFEQRSTSLRTSLRFYFLGGAASNVAVGQLVPTFEAVFLIFKFCHRVSYFFAASSASFGGGLRAGAFFTSPAASSLSFFTNLL